MTAEIHYGPEWPDANSVEEHLLQALQIVRANAADTSTTLRIRGVLTVFLTLDAEDESYWQVDYANFYLKRTDTIAVCEVVKAECVRKLTGGDDEL